MQISHELKMHATDMKNTGKLFRSARSPKWLVLALVIVAFLFGVSAGYNRGITDGTKSGEYVQAAMSSMEAKELARGNNFLAEKFHAHSVDRLVRNHVAETNVNFSQKVWRMMSPAFWLSRNTEKATHENIVRFAERRLSFVPTPRPETLEESARLGRVNQGDVVARWFDETAKSYSTLLGREIRGEQLAPDAYLREDILNLTQATSAKQ